MDLRRARIVLAGLGVSLLCAAPAAASTYDDYTDDGDIDGCSLSPGQIRDEIGNVPADVRQYDPGYVDALNDALNDDCGGGGGDDGSDSEAKAREEALDEGTVAGDGSPKPVGTRAATLAAAEPVDLSEDSGFPLALVGLVLLLGLLTVAGLVASGRSKGRYSLAGGPGGLRSRASELWWGIKDRVGR